MPNFNPERKYMQKKETLKLTKNEPMKMIIFPFLIINILQSLIKTNFSRIQV